MKTRLVITLLPLAALSACASVLSGSSQTISVSTVAGDKAIAGAHCKLSNDKGTWYLTSPASVTIHTSYHNLDVQCEYEGYSPNAGSAPSSTKTIVLGNILIGGLIGAAVDIGTGSAFEYPAPIIVNLHPAKTAEIGPFNGS